MAEKPMMNPKKTRREIGQNKKNPDPNKTKK